MLVLLPAKIIYEMTSGVTIFVNNLHANMIPVPLSHLVGGVVGLVVGIVIRDTSKKFSRFRLAYIQFSM